MRYRLNQVLSVAIVLGSGSVACGPGDYPEASLGHELQASRCGTTWEVYDVEHYHGGDPVFDEAFVDRFEGAFGRDCSGTMISPDLFLTVAHCEVQPGESVGFGCQLDGDEPIPSDPEEAAAAATANCEWFEATELLGDYGTGTPGGNPDASVSRLAGSPGNKYGWIFPSPRTPAVGEHLAIIQHPVTPTDRRKVVSFGDVVYINGKDVGYQIDSSGGGSGAGVLDKQGLLVAINRAHGCTDTGGANEGTSMEFVFKQVPEVRNLVVSAWVTIL